MVALLFGLAFGALQLSCREPEDNSPVGTWEIQSYDDGTHSRGISQLLTIWTTNELKTCDATGVTNLLGSIVRVDTTVTPFEVDWCHEGATNYGIFEISGDTMRLVLGGAGLPRLTEFRGSSNSWLRVLRRMQ